MQQLVSASVVVILCSFALHLGAQTSAPAAPDPYQPVLDRLQSITTIPLPDWQAHAADLPHGESAEVGAAGWEDLKAGDKWNTGSRWLRRVIEVPEQLNGYDLRGARLDLDLFITSDDFIQVSVFCNGNMVSRTDEDTQLPITLTQSAQPGQKFLIAARVIGNTASTRIYRAQVLVHAVAARPDPAQLRLEMVSARPLVGAYEEGKQERQRQLDAAINAVSVAALDRPDQAAFDRSLREARSKLEALRPYLNQFSIHLTGNSHIDMAWLWPWTETVEVVRNTFSSVLQLMREYPDLTFSMGSAQTFQWMEEKYPSLFQEIRQRVKEGRWEIVGGMWVEPDLNMPDGESLVRQLLYGKRYFREKFGVDVKIGWNPDSFGYNWQLPQIYKRSGVDYFVTQKLYWNDTNKFPHKLFWWQAPDGSRVMTYIPHDYANAIDPDRMAADLAVYAPAMYRANPAAGNLPSGNLDMMYLFGVGDHGGGPTRRDLDTALQWQRPEVVYPRLKFGTAAAFLDDMQRRQGELNLPVWNDELYFEYHRGVQTTQSETKRGNRKSEVALLNAEKLAAIGTLWRANYPRPSLDAQWKNVLFNQFHDVLPGSGIAVNYVDAARKYEEVQRVAGDLTQESLAGLAAQVNTTERSILVFNPLSWARGGVVEFEAYPGELGENPGFAADGRELPATVERGGPKVKVRLLVDAVPPLGYKLVKLVRAATPATASAQSLSSLENEFFRLAVDPHTGCLTSIYDKRAGAEALALAVPGEGAPAANPDGKPCGNLLQVFEDTPKRWDAWNIDADFIKQHTDLLAADEVTLQENSGLRTVVRVKKHYQNSQFVQDITLYPGVDRVDVRMTVDWHEKHKLLKVAFPLSVRSDHATFEIPYGSIARPTTRRTPEEQAKFEVPALRWADLSDQTHGFSLLNDGKYGYDARDNVLRLSLLRAPGWPDPHADEGRHEFTYSLYPHGGGWQEALTVRQGYELNDPLLATVVQPHPGGSWPESQSFFSVDADHVMISAVKQAQDGNGLVVRLYEWAGKQGQVQLRIPQGFSGAAAANLMEEELHQLLMSRDKRSVSAPVGAYEIKTIVLERLTNSPN
jgi:alpha-mannosidase